MTARIKTSRNHALAPSRSRFPVSDSERRCFADIADAKGEIAGVTTRLAAMQQACRQTSGLPAQSFVSQKR